MPEGREEVSGTRTVLGGLHCVSTEPELTLCLGTRCPFLVIPSSVPGFSRLSHSVVVQSWLWLVAELDLPDRHVSVQYRIPHGPPGGPLLVGAGCPIQRRPVGQEQIQAQRVGAQLPSGAHGDRRRRLPGLHAADRDSDQVMVADAARCDSWVGGEVWMTGDDVVQQGGGGPGVGRARDDLAQREATEQLHVRCDARFIWPENVEVGIS